MVEFRPQAIEASLKGDLDAQVQTGSVRLLAWASGVLVAALLVGLVPFEQVVVVKGCIRVVGSDAVIRATSTGVVREVLVKDGDQVEKGQPLVQMATPELDAALQKAQAENALASATGKPADAAAEREAVARLAEQERAMPLAAARITRAQERLASQQILVNEGLAPRQAVGVAEDEVDQAVADQTRAIQALSNARTELTTLRMKAEASGHAEANQLAAVRLQLDRMAVRSGHAGRVEWVGVLPGQAVNAGQRLLRVAPEGRDLPLEVLVLLPADKLGVLRAGERARVALDGFEVGDFGYGEATLAKVGRDPVSPDRAHEIHPAASMDQVAVEGLLAPRTWGRLRPEAGMTAKVWIILGRRSLLSRILAKIG